MRYTFLDKKVDLDNFKSENRDVEKYLKLHALKDQEDLISKTIIFLGDKEIGGYLTYCSCDLHLDEREIKKKNLKIYSRYPAIKLCRISKNEKLPNSISGKDMLYFFMGFCSEKLLKNHAFRFVVIDALKGDISDWFKKQGFIKNVKQDENNPSKKTVSMRFDLLDFKK